ncbi:MAG: hypothetical protein ACOX12_05005 [Eggerthellaceae bacterium]|jgi:acetyl esterase/lipase
MMHTAMSRRAFIGASAVFAASMLAGCASTTGTESDSTESETASAGSRGNEERGIGTSSTASQTASAGNGPYTRDTTIDEVRNSSVFGNWGRLIFPVNDSFMSGSTLGTMDLTWYTCIDPDKTVEISNYLHNQAQAGETVFLDIYTAKEKASDPDKRDTGLFFFRGKGGARTAFCNAGGGFAYVAAMHDSFPHALELSKHGYNAFALIYRPGAQTACEDLSRAIAYVSDHAEELGVNMEGYSLWGGSAGARMAAWVGTDGTVAFGEKSYPQPKAIIMQYTGFSEVTGNEPPTYACVGTADSIASWRTMRKRIRTIRANGTPARIEIFDGLQHGFGLGTGTVAEGWIDHAMSFWQRQVRR